MHHMSGVQSCKSWDNDLYLEIEVFKVLFSILKFLLKSWSWSCSRVVRMLVFILFSTVKILILISYVILPFSRLEVYIGTAISIFMDYCSSRACLQPWWPHMSDRLLADLVYIKYNNATLLISDQPVDLTDWRLTDCQYVPNLPKCLRLCGIGVSHRNITLTYGICVIVSAAGPLVSNSQCDC